MLTCVPESGNWNFDITGTSSDPARITLEPDDCGTILLGGSEFAVRTLYDQSWELKARGELVATAWKSSGISPIGWRPSFEVQAGALVITLQTQRLSSLQYDILVSSNTVGSISRKGRWFPKWPAFVECPSEVPELVQLFCFWLAMQSWREKGSGY